MEPIIATSRLRLTLIGSAERGSKDFEWLHELRSNEQTSWWSIYGRSKSLEDTERIVKDHLPTNKGGQHPYRVAYAVHENINSADTTVPDLSTVSTNETATTRMIGVVNLVSLDEHSLVLPEHLTLPAEEAATTLTLALSYMFLPTSWGKGYATESIGAVLEACRRARSFWEPYAKVYVRAIVNAENPASSRVLAKLGVLDRGVFVWNGKPVFLAGRWRESDALHIHGLSLLE